MRIAWFSPLPPDRSGIAAYSAEITPLLADRFGALDLYTAERHDFVWRHRRQPYDLTVYQLGNSAAHDFMWAYLFRYPGLLVLHDAQVHQARALYLLRRLEPRLEDYLAELRANHPDAPADLGHLVAAGLGGTLFRLWPLVSLVIHASRLTVVHNAHLARALSEAHPDAAITAIDMGVGGGQRSAVSDQRSAISDQAAVRVRHGIPAEACLVGAFGGITPEKRIPALLEALTRPALSQIHALLVGQRAAHYDVDADVERLGLGARVHIAGYVADEDLPAYLGATDVCWCLRWPSNGETSASWLRCLAAGRPTMTTALAHLRDVPTLEVNAAGVAPVSTSMDAVGIAIDPVDEAHDVAVALEALVHNHALRETLGANAQARWARRHTLPHMADQYARVVADAIARPAPHAALPAHLRDDGTATARRILSEMGVPELPW